MEEDNRENQPSQLVKAKPVYSPVPTALVPPVFNGPEFVPSEEELATVPEEIPEDQWNVPGEEVEYMPLLGSGKIPG
ncbi:MAG: hypothetical protein BWY11_00918 [Firmicutes bacterium ADurb.Bin182]|nr:MAG: hypothetical protein BWY11_00918 [Firmicutes bacterium ADurb.Bin182]